MSKRRLLTVGDSFTYGDELPNREVDAYPYLMKNLLGFDEVVNLGLCGASSDYVFRTTIETLINETFDLVLISWPEQSRFEALDLPNTEPSQFMSIRARIQKEPDWITDYYKYSYDIAWGFRKQFNQIIALQGFLLNRNQRYLMYNVAGLQGYYDEYYQLLEAQFREIDKRFFVGWPKDGILEWQGNCVKGPGGHPLELGHKRIAKVIDEYIRNISWIS